ncbi:hypothetical protein GC176_03235 [bacterium]|nr:hypothetical protein [bacterium]
MSLSDAEFAAKQSELAELRRRSTELESEILEAAAADPFRLTGFYTMYYATTGFMLGLVAAAMSLVVNVIGAPIVGKSPLEIIRIYLTFPLGERALSVTGPAKVYAVDNGVVLACGVCLYLVTGMLLGVPMHVVLARFTAKSSTAFRMVFAAVVGLVLWGIMFYGILSWLQPMVCGGSWITDGKLLPTWVAAGTHAVFGISMAALYPLGLFSPYHRPTTSV